jgi:hypothetical protein
MATILNRQVTFATNGTVTAAGLHNLIDQTEIYAGIITTQDQIASVGSSDQLLIADADETSTSAPRRVTVGSMFNDALNNGIYTTGSFTNRVTAGSFVGNLTGNVTGTIVGTTGTIATLNSTTSTITNLSATTSTFLGTITGSTNIINIGGGQIYKDGTGNVGVGTTSPSSKLTVGSGDIVISDNFGIGAGGGAQGIYNGTSQFVRFDTASTERLRIDSSGNVGIGTGGTAAASKLDVYGVGNFQALELGKSGRTGNRDCNIDLIGDDTYSDYGFRIIRNSTGSNTSTVLTHKGTGGLFIKTEEAGDIIFQTTNTERMRVDPSGNFLVNTTSTALFSATSGSGLCYRKGASLDILATNDNALILNKIGADGSIAEFRKAATAVGTISVSGSATAYNTSSDYRLKTNLDQISDGIARIKQLPVYRFNWLADVNGKKVDGFVAHEAKEIVPECVVGEKDAVDAEGNPIYQGIDQSKIVPLLTAALKEAISKIEILESKVAALEAA